MYFQKRNNTYRYYERYIDQYTQKRKIVSITLSSNSKQAQNKAMRLLNEKIRNKTALASDNIIEGKTLADLFDEWFPIYKQQVRRTTYLATVANIQTLLGVINKDTLLSQLDSSILSRSFDELLFKHDLSSKYVSIIKSKLNQAIKFAIKQNYLKDNPLDKVELSPKKSNHGTKIKDKFLEKDELTKLFDYIQKKHPNYVPIFQWLYLTGMRAGEALALDMDDIEYINSQYVVHVTGTLEYKKVSVTEQHKTDTTKTAAGIRDIDLSSQAVEIYQKQLDKYESGFLFQTANGTPYQISSLNTILRNAKDKLGIDKRLSTHTFRHTHVSMLAALGVPFYVIQDRVGHENSKMLEQIYLHVTKEAKLNLNSQLEKL